MSRYRVGGRTVDTAATADNVGAALWNPSTSKGIYVEEVHWAKVGATVDNPGLVRISARGTATTTVTPDIDNDDANALAPVSGALLDVAYSAQPTITAPYMHRTNLAAAGGAGFIWTFRDPGIFIPAGEGLAIATPVAVILQDSDVTFVWSE
jgi:hypothetical protein